jgi:hypothetical protein
MKLRRAALAALLPLLAAGPALAQAPAADPAAPVATANNSVTDAQIRAWITDAPPPSVSDDHDGVLTDKPQPLKMHGEAGVTIGSGGYRSVYAVAIMPLGDGATLGVSASDTHFGNNRWARGNRQTLGVSLAAGDPNGPVPPDGCLRVGGRFVEPLWAEQLRGPGDHCNEQRHGDEITQPPRR